MASHNMPQTERLAGMLGLATRAGKLIIGSNLTVAAVREAEYLKKGKKTPHLVLLATDASDNTKKKIQNCCTYHQVAYFVIPLSASELGHAIGNGMDVSAVGIADVGFSEAVKKILLQYSNADKPQEV